jgi:hypothetical protein
MINLTENIQKNNLFTELLVSNKNNSALENIQIQTVEVNSNQNQNQNFNINNDEIFNKYNELKNKINLFWNKVG